LTFGAEIEEGRRVVGLVSLMLSNTSQLEAFYGPKPWKAGLCVIVGPSIEMDVHHFDSKFAYKKDERPFRSMIQTMTHPEAVTKSVGTGVILFQLTSWPPVNLFHPHSSTTTINPSTTTLVNTPSHAKEDHSQSECQTIDQFSTKASQVQS
jgi:hypothetical protein